MSKLDLPHVPNVLLEMFSKHKPAGLCLKSRGRHRHINKHQDAVGASWKNGSLLSMSNVIFSPMNIYWQDGFLAPLDLAVLFVRR